jgi:very-short-patch-repair endonuclease
MNVIKGVAKKLRRNQTNAEQKLWSKLRNRKLGGHKFYRQYVIPFILDNEKRHFIADFCCFKEKLVIEVDGSVHEKQKDYDEVKDFIVTTLGYKVLRFANEEIELNLQQVLNVIIDDLG